MNAQSFEKGEEDARVLSRLAGQCREHARAFRQASGQAERNEIAAMLLAYSLQLTHFAGELEGEEGVEPEDENVPTETAPQRRPVRTPLQESEYRARALLRDYADALRSIHSPRLRTILIRQLAELRGEYERICSLRASEAGAPAAGAEDGW